jgi:hypothetical protein
MIFGFSAPKETLATNPATNRQMHDRNIPIPLFSLTTKIIVLRI